MIVYNDLSSDPFSLRNLAKHAKYNDVIINQFLVHQIFVIRSARDTVPSDTTLNRLTGLLSVSLNLIRTMDTA